MKKTIITTIIVVVVTLFCFDFNLTPVEAVTGTITGGNAYAWGNKTGWINFAAAGSNILITDSEITGYAWNSNYGWINLSPTTGGVKNTCAGALSGYAWSGTLGWINFSGATIDANGKFTGIIGDSDSTLGQINFDCTNCGVSTDWRPSCLSPTPTPTPTSVSTTSTTTSNTSTGGGTASCTAVKPGSAPNITSVISGANSATLTWSAASTPVTTYLVAYGTSPGSIQYGNPNVGNVASYTINGLSGGTNYYFKVKAINDCMPGDYSNEVSTTPGGGTTTGPAAGFTETTGNPSQLFDIALVVDETKISKVSDLKARVTFVSFGTELTPVKMHFKIVDANGKGYYNSDDSTEIQTEGVFNKAFEGLSLTDGKYTLVLTTTYNSNITDEFKQDFEVSNSGGISKGGFCSCNWPFLGWPCIIIWIVPILFVFWVGLFFKRRKDKKKNSKTFSKTIKSKLYILSLFILPLVVIAGILFFMSKLC